MKVPRTRLGVVTYNDMLPACEHLRTLAYGRDEMLELNQIYWRARGVLEAVGGYVT